MYKLIVLVADIYNRTKVVGPQPFQAANFIGYNLILRYPQLVEVDPKIHFKIGTFKQWNNKELEGRMLLISLKDILEDIELDKIVYVLYLKEYQIQPLFYSKIGIEPSISDNPFITDTLQGTARQVTEILQGGGDLKDLIRYFYCYGLLWLKQYVENILQHLKRYVKEFPTLYQLLYATI